MFVWFSLTQTLSNRSSALKLDWGVMTNTTLLHCFSLISPLRHMNHYLFGAPFVHINPLVFIEI